MPLYTYSCSGCGSKFERLAKSVLRDEQQCSNCGVKATRSSVDTFAVKSTIDPKDKVVQTNKEIDIVIGRDADRRRGAYEAPKKARREGMVEIADNVSAGSTSSFNPDSVMGDDKRKNTADAYNKALKSGDPAVKTGWLEKADLTAKGSGFRKLDQ